MGQVARLESFDSDLEFMGFYDFPQNELVVVSSPKKILKEWRFVIAAGKVVTGCLYQDEDKQVYRAEYDPAAFELASKIGAQGYQPDPAWIIDICKTSEGEYKMLEIGGFSFSNLYACDLRKVVREVSKVAMKAHDNYSLQDQH